MVRILGGVAAVLLLTGNTVSAQFHESHRAYQSQVHGYPEHHENLVRGWHDHLFHRVIPPHLLQRWVGDLERGVTPMIALAGMLASPEFYIQVGSTPGGFINGTFQEIVGRPPSPAEFQYWQQRLYIEDRNQVANEIISRYPPVWASGLSPTVPQPAPVIAPSPIVISPPLYEYRRPIWPYHRR